MCKKAINLVFTPCKCTTILGLRKIIGSGNNLENISGMVSRFSGNKWMNVTKWLLLEVNLQSQQSSMAQPVANLEKQMLLVKAATLLPLLSLSLVDILKSPEPSTLARPRKIKHNPPPIGAERSQ